MNKRENVWSVQNLSLNLHRFWFKLKIKFLTIDYFKMKKIAMFLAAAAIAVSASAQRTAVTANKAGDNFYVGLHAGAATTLTNYYDKMYSPFGQKSAFSAFAAQAGVRVGKNFTTVFGLALDANVYFKNHSHDCPFKLGMTFIQAFDVDLLGTANLMNLFAGYKGEPRLFEVIALGGFGWTHVCPLEKTNGINSKVGFDFAFNLGAKKAWQVYLEPSLVYYLQGYSADDHAFADLMAGEGFKFNSNKALFSLNVGVNYKFGTSNGTHNFAKEQLRDQAEIDALNAKLNATQAEANAAKANSASLDGKIADLQKAVNDCMNKPAAAAMVKEARANLPISVIFDKGKSIVKPSQEANVELIAKYMQNNKDAKIKISGYATPEGPAALNQTLSEKRAEACKDILVKKYKIDASRIQTEGLGTTDKIFDEYEFNRVALFNDTTK